jgi:putative ABC transport system substrate-binding protein
MAPAADRRRFLLAITSLALGGRVAPAAAQAAPGPGAARVGLLTANNASPPFNRLFLETLRESGWVEGRNLAYEVRAADGQYDRLPALAADLLRWQPHVLVTVQTPATQTLMKLTTTIPIVMSGHGDPVRYGLIRDLARPEGNVTGVSFLVNEVAVKTVELLKEAAPHIGRVAVVTNPDNPGAAPVFDAIRSAAPALAIGVQRADARTVAELDQIVSGLGSASGIFLGPEALIITHRQRIIDAGTTRKIPVVGASSVFGESGALLSYAPHGPSIVRDTARFVDRLLRGARPADLPVEQPARFELIVNQKTARALGLVVPPALLLRADRVID